MVNLLKHEILSRKMVIIGWSIGLTLYGALYIGIYPEMQDMMGDISDLSVYEAMNMDMASFAGFIASVVVQLLPVVLGIYVIIVSTGTLAGEEDNGTLELVVAMPLARWQIVAMKFIGLAVVLTIILALVGAGNAGVLSIVKQNTEVDVTSMQLFTAILSAVPLMVAFLSIGMFLASVMPSRRLAVAVMTMIYLGSYVMQSVSTMVESTAFLGNFSLFTYLDSSATRFATGTQLSDVAVLVAVSAVFMGLTLLSFQRRNITVGEWTWFRGQSPA